MKALRRKAVVTAVLCATSTLTAVHAADGATDPSGVPLFAGRLLHHDGTPAGGVTVTASRFELSGDTPDTASLQSVPLTSTVTDDGGYFSVDVPSVDDAANYELTGVVDGEEVVYDFTPATVDDTSSSRAARAPQPTVAVIKAGSGALTTPSGQPRRLGADAPPLLESEAADEASYLLPPAGYQPDDDDMSDPDGPSSPPDGEPVVPPADGVAPTDCVAPPVWGHIKGVYKMRYLPVRAILTAAHSSQKYVYATGSETTSGGVLEVGNDFSALSPMHGTTDSFDQSITWPGTKLDNDTTWSLWIEWDFEKWQAYCPGIHGAVKMDMTKWTPWDVAGGSKHKVTPVAVTCTQKHPIDGKYTYTEAHTESWGGWFSVLGVKLDTNTTQSTMTQISVIPDNTLRGNSEKNPTYCSSGKTMDSSAWFNEVS